MPHDYKALAARVTKLEGGVALAQAGALVALDTVHALGTAEGHDMGAMMRHSRNRLHYLRGQVALMAGDHGPAFSLPELPSHATGTKTSKAPKKTKGEKGTRKQRVCVVTGKHQVCKDRDGVKIRKMPRLGTHEKGTRAVHKPKTP